MTPESPMISNNEVRVWDPFIRFFHWLLVVAFIIAYVVEEDIMTLHVWCGYTILALLLTRLIWGLVGTEHARFSDFVTSPSTTVSYLKSLMNRNPKRYLGHNPAGGAMIVVLLLTLLALCISGVALYGADQHAGPMAGMMAGVSEQDEEFLEEVHEFLANFSVFLIVIHVGGVLVESLLHKENLVRAMLTGNKRSAL